MYVLESMKHDIVMHLMLKTTLGGRFYHHPHFIDEKIEG